MIKAKLKHVSVRMVTRKNKILLEVETRNFNSQKGTIQEKNTHIIKGKTIDHIYSFIMAKKTQIRESEVSFMTSLLKETQ